MWGRLLRLGRLGSAAGLRHGAEQVVNRHDGIVAVYGFARLDGGDGLCRRIGWFGISGWCRVLHRQHGLR